MRTFDPKKQPSATVKLAPGEYVVEVREYDSIINPQQNDRNRPGSPGNPFNATRLNGALPSIARVGIPLMLPDKSKILSRGYIIGSYEELQVVRIPDRAFRVSVITRNHEGVHVPFEELKNRFRPPRKIVETQLDRLSFEEAVDLMFDDVGGQITDDKKSIIINRPPMEKEFWRRLEEMERAKIPMNVVRLFHGTRSEFIPAILKEGLKPGRPGCAFGAGIYTGRWEKAVNYSSSSMASNFEAALPKLRWGTKSARRRSERKREAKRAELLRSIAVFEYPYIFEVDVNLGLVFEPKLVMNDAARASMEAAGCHSVFYDGFRNSEWVVYHPNQVLIRKVHRKHDF